MTFSRSMSAANRWQSVKERTETMAAHDCPDFELPGRDLPLLAWATDDQGKDFWVNPAWQATVGAPVVEILEKSRFSWIHPADRGAAIQRFDQACLNHAPLRFR